MELVENKISFEYFKKHCRDIVVNSKNFGCDYDGVRYGMGMSAVWIGVCIESANSTEWIGYESCKERVKFKRVLQKTVQYVAQNDICFEKMLNYSSERQFHIYSEKEYQNEQEFLSTHKSQSNADVFRDLSFVKNEKRYHMSVNVNICQQMLYCCDIVPENELNHWFFVLKKYSEYETSDSEDYKTRCKKANQMSDESLYKKYCQRKNNERQVNQNKGRTINKRDEIVAEIAKRRAKGICELPDSNGRFHEAPFSVDGKPFLESHHVIWLSKGGEDDIDNVVALCPNCHRKMHILQNVSDVDKLKNRLLKYSDMLKSIDTTI